MKKWILALAVLALPAVALAQQLQAANHNVRYDVDSATPIYCTLGGPEGAWAQPYTGAGNLKTVGSSLTITSYTALSSALAGVDVGDVLSFDLSLIGGGLVTRTVVTNADDNTVTVDEAIDLSRVNGYPYFYRRHVCGTTATSGWIKVASPFQIHVQYDAGDLDALKVRLQCKGGTVDDGPVNVIGPTDSCGGNTNDTTGACELATPGVGGSLTWVELSGTWDACRMGLWYKTTDTSDAGANRESVTVSVTRVVR